MKKNTLYFADQSLDKKFFLRSRYSAQRETLLAIAVSWEGSLCYGGHLGDLKKNIFYITVSYLSMDTRYLLTEGVYLITKWISFEFLSVISSIDNMYIGGHLILMFYFNSSFDSLCYI